MSGRLVIGEAYAMLRNMAVSQRHVRLLVLDLAHLDRIDAGGLGVLLAVREWARANAITFKLMNVMNRVEQMLQLTGLDRVFGICSVPDLLCLLHRAVVIASWPFEQSIHVETRDRFWPAR